MPVQARRLIRKMRGGAQAHLIEADDGHCYVVKFKNNPQHRRILVNELLASSFLHYLQITTPETALVELSPSFLEGNPGLHLQLGNRKVPVEQGRHFGSRFPGDPDRLAVFDFLPDVLLSQVANSPDFLGAFVFDKWTANADGRQTIFFRASVRDGESAGAGQARFVTSMVDQGYIFDGPKWRFIDSHLQGLYHRPMVYHSVTCLDDFQPWLDRMRHFPEEVVDQACKQVPREWLGEDEAALEQLLTRLLERRKRIEYLIEDACGNARGASFPNWTGSGR
ncbi:MAG: hypothetical protein JJE04_11620 [Acidobacteriia bacterium]|nr:hypothetical protein [Terriglobia bacterium]